MQAGMTRHLLTVLALLFLLPDARAQAPAIRPPARPVVPPALTPGYNPNTPPDPVYTPPGTGLPEVGQPGTHAAPVKRSPNTRALPDEFSPTKEPGIWAADGAPQASAAPAPLFSVPLPAPAPEAGLGTRLLMDRCIESVTDAAGQVGKRSAIDAFPESVRACLASVYIFACGHDESLRLVEAAREGADVTADEIKAAANLQAHGRALRAKNCPGAGVTSAQQGVFDEIMKRWMNNEYNGKTSRSTH
jgi:hypothetical protein